MITKKEFKTAKVLSVKKWTTIRDILNDNDKHNWLDIYDAWWFACGRYRCALCKLCDLLSSITLPHIQGQTHHADWCTQGCPLHPKETKYVECSKNFTKICNAARDKSAIDFYTSVIELITEIKALEYEDIPKHFRWDGDY